MTSDQYRETQVRNPGCPPWTLGIVDESLWREVQERREQRRFSSSGTYGGARPLYLLTGLLECGECTGRYVVSSRHRGCQVYSCAVHKERGPLICQNGKTVRRNVIETHVLHYVFHDLFGPAKLAYLSAAVDAAYARAIAQPEVHVRDQERALAKAKTELAAVAEAIRQGIITPTKRAMLEEAEERVAALETALEEARRPPSPIEPLALSVERYLHDLRSTVNVNPKKGRRLLARSVERIVLQREGPHLVAHFFGTLAGIVRIGDNTTGDVPSDGAGAGGRSRTADTGIFSPLLYHLSYPGNFRKRLRV